MSTDLARAAYEALEPYHVLAYFNPHLKGAMDDTGLDELGVYVGGRGGPLGRCPSALVAATFFNFNPAWVAHGWTEALGVGLPTVEAARTKALESALHDALGDALHSPDLATVVSALRVGIVEASYAGRPLASAWAAAPWPSEPHLQMWHATAVIREHRGDGHIAALVLADLTPIEALVFHEAPHPDPTLRPRTLGKRLTLLTRGWSEQEWASATESLHRRGLLDTAGVISTTGAALQARLEEQTDEAAAGLWAQVPEAAQMLRLARPFVKAVIDVGYLPGTRKG